VSQTEICQAACYQLQHRPQPADCRTLMSDGGMSERLHRHRNIQADVIPFLHGRRKTRRNLQERDHNLNSLLHLNKTKC
jgi:hypothetical protein